MVLLNKLQRYYRVIVQGIFPVQQKILISYVVIGGALTALLLNAACQPSASLTLVPTFPDPGAAAANSEGQRLSALGRYVDARTFFISAARLADAAGDGRAAAMNHNNAGAVELVTMQYGEALKDFAEARRIAEASHQPVPLFYSLNNLASLYVQTGQAENALRVAREALSGPVSHTNELLHAKLLCQMSNALSQLHRFDEAKPIHKEAVARLTALNQMDDLARLQAQWANDNLIAGQLDEADEALNQGLALVRDHKVKAAASIFGGLANLAGKRHQTVEAEKLFQAALDVREDRTPRWRILADRGRFHLEMQQDERALVDFREAGRLVAQVRADMVPADQDRVAFESGIGEFLRGLVEAGNRVALRTGNAALVAETFDASEQGRLWSLRSLVPGTSDWRSRLPATYWEKLAHYKTLQRRVLASNGPEDPAAATLRLQLQVLEAEAGSQTPGAGSGSGGSALRHVRALLDRDAVLFSFHSGPVRSWMWASDQSGTRVFPLPAEAELQKATQAFSANIQSPAAGKALYQTLFGPVPASFLQHSRWLLEPDGALHDVPFAALVAGELQGRPFYLAEKAAIQIIPGALLLEKRAFRVDGLFVGLGDPVYNAGDQRFPGGRVKPEYSLPRLPNTAREVQACASVWGRARARVLTGMDATEDNLWKMAAEKPSVLHFATHVVKGAGEYRSGLIALRLNPSGAMELLGPREILARSVAADLVVMNGCHSEQGEAVPSSGRMGLTRAWIGAGAGSVLATRWDISDDDAESLVSDFYRRLRSSPGTGLADALRQAQIDALRSGRQDISRWAGYYLLSRAL